LCVSVFLGRSDRALFAASLALAISNPVVAKVSVAMFF
jgi:hypothetical protein